MRNVNDYYDRKFRDFINRVEAEDARQRNGCFTPALALLLALCVASCHPKFLIPTPEMPEVCIPVDTVLEVRERVVTDTIVFAPEWVTVHDTVACPPGLVRDSLVYRTKRVLVPGDTVFATRTERDTVRVERVAHTGGGLGGMGASNWLTWLLWVASILLAWWVSGRKK